MGTMPPYDDVLATTADWIMENWKEKRKPRLALFLGNYASGRSPKLAKWYCEKKGVEVVGKEIVPFNPDDATPYLIKIKKYKPDYVLLRLMANGAAIFLKDSRQVGLKAPIVGNYIAKPGDIERLVASRDLLDGFMLANLFGVLEDKGAWGMDLAREICKEYRKKSLPEMGSMYWWGVGVGMIVEEALRVAVKSVGAKNMTSAIMKEKGLDEVTNLDTGGILGTVTIKAGDHRSIVQHRIIGYKNGNLKVLRDWTDNAPFINVK